MLKSRQTLMKIRVNQRRKPWQEGTFQTFEINAWLLTATDRPIIKNSQQWKKKYLYNNRQITDDLEESGLWPQNSIPAIFDQRWEPGIFIQKHSTLKIQKEFKKIMFYLQLSNISRKPASAIANMQLKWLKWFVSHMLCIAVQYLLGGP